VCVLWISKMMYIFRRDKNRVLTQKPLRAEGRGEREFGIC